MWGSAAEGEAKERWIEGRMGKPGRGMKSLSRFPEFFSGILCWKVGFRKLGFV